MTKTKMPVADELPGLRYFMFLAGLALLGVFAIALLMWLSGKKEG